MRKAVVLPAVSVAGGIFGLAVRQFQLNTAFEPGTGLPIADQPATYAMWAVVAVTVLAIVGLCMGKHRTFEKCYTSAFRTTSMIQLSGAMAGAVLLLAAGFFNVEAFVSAPVDPFTQIRSVSIVRPILGVVCLAAAAGVWFTVQKMKGGQQVKSVWVLLPGLVGCLWVMANYQSWAQDPVIEQYVFSLLAVMLSMVGCYFLAGFAFGKGQVKGALIACLLGASFCIVALGDGLPMYDVALYVAMIFYLLSMASTLLTNDAKPEPPEGLPSCGGSCQGCPGCGPVPEPENDNESK